LRKTIVCGMFYGLEMFRGTVKKIKKMKKEWFGKNQGQERAIWERTRYFN